MSCQSLQTFYVVHFCSKVVDRGRKRKKSKRGFRVIRRFYDQGTQESFFYVDGRWQFLKCNTVLCNILLYRLRMTRSEKVAPPLYTNECIQH